jgi:hypothetical protein
MQLRFLPISNTGAPSTNKRHNMQQFSQPFPRQGGRLADADFFERFSRKNTVARPLTKHHKV